MCRLYAAVLKFESGKFAAFAEDLGGSEMERSPITSMRPRRSVCNHRALSVSSGWPSKRRSSVIRSTSSTWRAVQSTEYKGAGEMFVRRGFSEEARRSPKALIDSWMSDITAAVAEAETCRPREFDGSRIRDRSWKEALDNGLIDALSYRDEFEKTLESKVGASAEIVSVGVYNKFNVPAPADAMAIAVITGTGAMFGRGKSPSSRVGSSTPTTSPKPFGTLPKIR